jgi:hypothetical protein
MLRIIAIIANFVWVIFLLFGVMDSGFPQDEEEIFIAVFAAFTLALNLSTLLFISGRGTGIWPFVYFKRKSLEEKIKIEKLIKEREAVNK